MSIYRELTLPCAEIQFEVYTRLKEVRSKQEAYHMPVLGISAWDSSLRIKHNFMVYVTTAIVTPCGEL